MTVAPENEGDRAGFVAQNGYRLGELVDRLGGELIGDPAYRVVQVATLRSARPEHISFLHQSRYAEELAASNAGAVILGPHDRDSTLAHRIVTENPYLYFARVSTLLNARTDRRAGAHPSATIALSAKIHTSAQVGPGSTVDAEVEIGADVSIGAGAWVGEGVSIEAETRIDPGVHIYPRTRIGKRCVVLAGAVIGSDGFGFARDGERWIKIPQIGRVLIGDDVEIGANTTIDRGALDDTVIEDGVKLDNQIQIGHNCRIGAHTAIAGCVGIAGSTTLGKRCMIGGAAMIAGHLTLADGVVVSGGTLVSKSIDVAGVYTGVYPFEPNKRWLKNAALVRQLSDMATRLRALERQLHALEKKS